MCAFGRRLSDLHDEIIKVGGIKANGSVGGEGVVLRSSVHSSRKYQVHLHLRRIVSRGRWPITSRPLVSGIGPGDRAQVARAQVVPITRRAPTSVTGHKVSSERISTTDQITAEINDLKLLQERVLKDLQQT